MPKRKLRRLTDRGELVSYVLYATAYGTHGDEAELETMVKKLGTTSGRVRPTLCKLSAQSWLTIEGKSAEFVYPTVAAIQAMNPKVSQKEAAAVVRKLH
jgi:hypothetical protein